MIVRNCDNKCGGRPRMGESMVGIFCDGSALFATRNSGLYFLFDIGGDFCFFIFAGVREGGENPPRTRRCK